MAQGTPNFAINPVRGAGLVQIGDTSRLQPLNPVDILTAGTAGSRIERIVMEALGPTVASVLRLWFWDGTNHHLWDELPVSAQGATASNVMTAATLEAVTAPNLLPELLPQGWKLRASINDTQVAAEMNLTSIGLAQTTAGAAALSLNGPLVTAATSAAIAPLQTLTANTGLNLNTSPYVGSAPFIPTLTSTSNLSAISFLFIGRDATGAFLAETLTGPNNNTVPAVNVYKALDAVIPLTTSASTVSVGTTAIAGSSSILTMPSPIMLSSPGNLSAVNFTFTGTTSKGLKQTETLAGPNAGQVSTANSYASLFSITSSAAVGILVSVGNPTILSGIRVHAIGGNF